MVDVDELTAAILEMAGENAEEMQPAFDLIVKEIMGGKLPKDAIGMDSRTLEGLYSQAYNHYNSGKYIEAARLFHTLQLLDGTEPKFQLGLAACYQMLEEYKNAILVFANLTLIDPETPVPHFHTSDCYLKMDLVPAAIAELEMTVELCGEQPQYEMMKERAMLRMEQLKEKGALDKSLERPPEVEAPEE